MEDRGAPRFKKLPLPNFHTKYGMKAQQTVFYESPMRNDHDEINWVEYAASTLPAPARKRFDSVAIQIFKKIDKQRTMNNVPRYFVSFIKIQSPILLDNLRKILPDRAILPNDTQLKIKRPFEQLFFAWNEIEALCSDPMNRLDAEEREHLQVLRNFVHNELSEGFEEARRLHRDGCISEEFLWTLYPEGSFVLTTSQGFEEVLKVQSFDKKGEKKRSGFNLKCEHIKFDGFEYGFVEKNLTINNFDGSKPINELSVFPYKYVQDARFRERLIQRGRNALQYQSFKYLFYDGIALENSRKMNVSSRVIVDPYLYASIHEEEIRPFPRWSELDEEQSDEQDTKNKATSLSLRIRPDEAQQALNQRHFERDCDYLVLLSPFIRGFSLSDKAWLNFLVDYLKPVVLNCDAFDHLVLPPYQKEQVLSFAQEQDKKLQDIGDIISGKGQGLLVLLSGPPGTGKTLTAEAVADRVGRPLYHIDTREIGTNPSNLSVNFRKIMDLAAEWNAIVLLDEADVFLESRKPGNVVRNETVAVFLRELEYYRGTMFLTTNLLDTIDEATESRMHLHIKFKRLPAESRAIIWRNFLRLWSKDLSITTSISEEDLQRLAKWELNGRQIKNSVQMAVKRCYYGTEELTIQNIEQVIQLTCPSAFVGDGSDSPLEANVQKQKSFTGSTGYNLLDL